MNYTTGVYSYVHPDFIIFVGARLLGKSREWVQFGKRIFLIVV